MKLTYNGPADAVNLLATGQRAERGKPIDITDEATAASLIEQGWTEPKPAKKAAPAAAVKASPDAPKKENA